jgi:DNA-directed RNA polymerase specialized sigma24 family protein
MNPLGSSVSAIAARCIGGHHGIVGYVVSTDAGSSPAAPDWLHATRWWVAPADSSRWTVRGSRPIFDLGQVRRALDALPGPDREIIRLQHNLALSPAEIADYLAVPLDTVRCRSLVAHRHLAALLGRATTEPAVCAT